MMAIRPKRLKFLGQNLRDHFPFPPDTHLSEHLHHYLATLISRLNCVIAHLLNIRSGAMYLSRLLPLQRCRWVRFHHLMW